METLQNISRPVTHHGAVLEDKACKGLIPALETAILVYEKLASLTCDHHALNLLQALEVAKKTQRMRLRALVDGQPLLEITLSDLLWDRLDDIAASVDGTGQFLAEAETLAFAMSMEETVWQAYLQACLATADDRAKLLATQLSEQQAHLARTVATRIRRLKGGLRGGSWQNKQCTRDKELEGMPLQGQGGQDAAVNWASGQQVQDARGNRTVRQGDLH